jgi:hypothetical protein
MKTPKNIEVLFVAGFGPIARDPAASRKFYSEALALQFKEDANGYLHTGRVGWREAFCPVAFDAGG